MAGEADDNEEVEFRAAAEDVLEFVRALLEEGAARSSDGVLPART